MTTVDAYTEDIEPELKFEAIFDEAITTGQIPLMNVIIARIKSKFQIPTALKILNKLPGGDKLKHLKRIKPLEEIAQTDQANNDDQSFDVVIATCSTLQSEDYVSDIKSMIEDLRQEEIFYNYRIQPVPSAPPKTELQLGICSKVWPCKYAKSTYLAKCLDGSILGPSERMMIKVVVSCLLKDIAQRYASDRRSVSAGVVFYDYDIVATSLIDDKTVGKNPLKHAAMVAVDNVAKSIGSGYWKTDSVNICNEELLQETLKSYELTKINNTSNTANEFIPYLCTNYSIILTEEPCLMCCMALVHSRIKRIFFLDLSTYDKLFEDRADLTGARICYDDKALTKLRLHCDRNINHRYEVWRIYW